MSFETSQSTFLPEQKSTYIMRWLFGDGGCHSASGVITLSSGLPGWHQQIHREQDFGVNLYWPQHMLWRLSLSLLKIECNNNRTRNQDSTIFCCLQIPVGRHVALEVRKLGPEFQLYPSSQCICTVSIIIPHLRVAGWTEVTSSHLWRDTVKERNFCSVFVLLSGAHQLRVEMNCSGWQKGFKEVIEVKGRKEKTTGREEEFGRSDGEFD